MSFETLGLGIDLLKSIKESGYSEPTPIQASAIPLIIEGKDLIGIAQTGTGKTAAFTLPMLERLRRKTRNEDCCRTRALVLSPTRELVVQIHENMESYGRYVSLQATEVYGGVGEVPQKKALRRGVDVVIATPGRLMDLMDRGCADFSKLDFFVLDEADRMLDMGFLPNIRKIVKALPRQRQTLLFSATLSKEIEKLTREFQRFPELVEIGKRSNPADSVIQCLYEVPKPNKIKLLTHLLEDRQLYSVLVFARTKHGADRLAKQLGRNGVSTGAIHSNRTQNQRSRALQDFKDGKIRVLVATDVAARGIDVEGITHVVNFDFPPHPDDYVHRIGRTGRAKAAGEAINFVTNDDRIALRNLEKSIGRTIPRKTMTGIDLQVTSQEQKNHKGFRKYSESINQTRSSPRSKGSNWRKIRSNKKDSRWIGR